MAQGFSCPNPACTHVFPLAQVQGAPALTCPRCGKYFKFRPGTVVAPSAAPAAVAAPAADEDFVVESPLARPRRQQSSPLGGILMTASLLVIVVGLLVGGFLAFRGRPARDPAAAAVSGGGSSDEVIHGVIWNYLRVQEKAFRLTLPRATWSADAAVKKGLNAAVALHRDKQVWLAVAAQDHGSQTPPDAELLREAKERLKNLFRDNLETGATKPGQLAGHAAQRLEFRGTRNQVAGQGECYLFSQHGIGYWVFVWSDQLEKAQQALAELQRDGKGFAVTAERKGWKERTPQVQTFAASKFDLSVSSPEGVWARARDEGGREPSCYLYLDGRARDDPTNLRKGASALVVVLGPQPNLDATVKAARDYVVANNPSELQYSVYASPGAKASETGVDGPVGNKQGRLLELQGTDAGEPRRYRMLAVVSEPEHVFVILCDCLWPEREAWRPQFRELIGSFQLKSGKALN
jgi:hypothetical protein